MTRVVPMVLAVLMIGALLLTRAGAQQPIDLTGDWEIELEGSVSVSCTGTITQEGTALTLDNECTLVGHAVIEGTIDPETGAFTLEGTVVGFFITLEGSASADGSTISGTWVAETLGFSGTFEGIRAGMAETPTPLPTLPAPVNLTGTWRVQFSGIFSGTCDSVIVQDGTDLRSVANCTLIGTLSSVGMIDAATGALSLNNSLVTLEGVAVADGNSITGTWNALGFNGAFTSTRVDDLELTDLSGQWDLVLTGAIEDVCALTIAAETLLDSTATVTCDGLGSGELSGETNPLLGSVALSGTVEGREMELYLRASEGAQLTGSWFQAEEFGTALALPAGGLNAGLLALDCNAEQPGLQLLCFRTIGTPWTMAVRLVVPPPEAYTGFQIELAGLVGPVGYVPTDDPSDELVATFCGALERTLLEDGVRFRCETGEPPQTETAAADLLHITVACVPGVTVIDFVLPGGGAGSYLLDGAGDPLEVALLDMPVECIPPQQGGPGPSPGDVDCDGETSSIDAALILQYDAGLIGSLACGISGDVSEDGDVNSIDAALVLQMVAGLLARA